MKKLNLGCGSDYREGYINLDIGKKDIYGRENKVDVIHNLNKYPYPFKDGTFEEILMRGVLEHIKNLEKIVKEFARISKNNAILIIEVPYFLNFTAYKELYTHKFALNSPQLISIFKKNNIKLISRKLKTNNKFLKFIDSFINQSKFTQNFYERFLAGIFQVSQIVWVFKVKK